MENQQRHNHSSRAHPKASQKIAPPARGPTKGGRGRTRASPGRGHQPTPAAEARHEPGRRDVAPDLPDDLTEFARRAEGEVQAYPDTTKLGLKKPLGRARLALLAEEGFTIAYHRRDHTRDAVKSLTLHGLTPKQIKRLQRMKLDHFGSRLDVAYDVLFRNRSDLWFATQVFARHAFQSKHGQRCCHAVAGPSRYERRPHQMLLPTFYMARDGDTNRNVCCYGMKSAKDGSGGHRMHVEFRAGDPATCRKKGFHRDHHLLEVDLGRIVDEEILVGWIERREEFNAAVDDLNRRTARQHLAHMMSHARRYPKRFKMPEPSIALVERQERNHLLKKINGHPVVSLFELGPVTEWADMPVMLAWELFPELRHFIESRPLRSLFQFGILF